MTKLLTHPYTSSALSLHQDAQKFAQLVIDKGSHLFARCSDSMPAAASNVIMLESQKAWGPMEVSPQGQIRGGHGMVPSVCFSSSCISNTFCILQRMAWNGAMSLLSKCEN